MQPWHVSDPGGRLDVVLMPRFEKHSTLGGPAGSETHQVFGLWSGRLLTDDGLALESTVCRDSPRRHVTAGDRAMLITRIHDETHEETAMPAHGSAEWKGDLPSGSGT